jgi:nanoRNase/pAp phosphatase (c-di-AMP/oligoRNAs hydrolase)
MQKKSEKKAKDLIQLSQGKKRVLIITKDYPNPDSISSAAALSTLIRESAAVDTIIITCAGMLGANQNRFILEFLKITFLPFEQIDLADFDLIAMVDTLPNSFDNPRLNKLLPHIVISNDLPIKRLDGVAFVDIRNNYCATASILWEYLRYSNIEISRELSTALVYGIRTESQEYGRETSRHDLEAFIHAFTKSNRKLLSKIAHSKRSREYYLLLREAMTRTFYCDNVIICRLGQIVEPEIIPEFALLAIRLEHMTWALSLGRCEHHLLLHIRTTNMRANAEKVMRGVIGDKRPSLGYRVVASSKIDISGCSAAEIEQREDEYIARFLKILKKADQSCLSLLNESSDPTS